MGERIRLCIGVDGASEVCGAKATLIFSAPTSVGETYGQPFCDRHGREVLAAAFRMLKSAGSKALTEYADARGLGDLATSQDVDLTQSWLDRAPFGAHVYFAIRGDMLKIGFTERPAFRLKALLLNGGVFDELLLVPGPRLLEARLHRRFKADRILAQPGEWFRLSDRIMTLVAELRDRTDVVRFRLPAPADQHRIGQPFRIREGAHRTRR